MGSNGIVEQNKKPSKKIDGNENLILENVSLKDSEKDSFGADRSSLAKKLVKGLRCAASSVKKASLKIYSKAFMFLYPLCYMLGAFTMTFFKRSFKRIAPVIKVAVLKLGSLLLRPVRYIGGSVKSEALKFKNGFSIAGEKMRTAKAEGAGAVAKTSLSLPVLAIRRHFNIFAGVGKLALSAFAVFLLVSTVKFWTGSNTFALAVEYDGETIGYIQNESVFDVGADMATAKVINPDNSFRVERVPNLTLAVVNPSQVINETDICERILRNSSDALAELSGIYIEGEFAGAVQSRKALDLLLEERLSEFSAGTESESVNFLEKIEIVEGIYPVTSLKTVKAETESTPAMLTFSANSYNNYQYSSSMNDIIREKTTVKVVRHISYTEEIKFEKKVEDSNELYVGEQKVKSAGANGEKLFTADLVFVNGVETNKTITSEKITKEVVHNVTLKGVKKPAAAAPSQNGDGISTGSFVWPVPGHRQVWSGFGYRGRSMHKGIDISNGGIFNKPIIAADGGKVVEVVTSGWGGGYGLSVVIDHGNGIKTRYAHMNSVDVRVGQKITRGQMLGRVGNTGNSSGPHLHFEVIVNGTAVNPMNYL